MTDRKGIGRIAVSGRLKAFLVLGSIVLVLLAAVGGSAWAQPAADGGSWTPDPMGAYEWTARAESQIPSDPRIADACVETARDWLDRQRAVQVELQVYACRDADRAAHWTGAFYRNLVALDTPPALGPGIDFVARSGPWSCDLQRVWTQGSSTIVMITASPNLSVSRCVEINTAHSLSFSRHVGGVPTVFADVRGEIADSLVREIPMAMFGILGCIVFLATLLRPSFPLPKDRRQFVDVGRLARFSAWMARLWSLVRIGRWVALGTGLYQLVISVTHLSILAFIAGLGLLLISYIAHVVARVLRKQDFLQTGAESYVARALAGDGGRAFLYGSIVRFVARLAALLVVTAFVVAAALMAVVGPNGQLAEIGRIRLSGLSLSEYTGRDFLFAGAFALWEAPVILVPVSLFVLLYFTFLLDRFGAAVCARRARRALATDQRRHILYLRNFGDDKIKVAVTSELSTRGSLAEFNLFRRTRFEEAIVQRLNRHGPVIAVSDPGNSMRTLGAAKLSLPNDGWFEPVRELGATAFAVVISAAPRQLNDGLRREIAMVARMLCHDRIILVLPPAGRRRALQRRWSEFLSAAKTFSVFAGVSAAGGHGSAQVVAHTANGWIGWGATHRSEATYVTSLNEATDTVVARWASQFDPLPETGTVTRAWMLAREVATATGVSRISSALLLAAMANVDANAGWERIVPVLDTAELADCSRDEDPAPCSPAVHDLFRDGFPVSAYVAMSVELCTTLCHSYGLTATDPGVLATVLLADPRAGAAVRAHAWTARPHAQLLYDVQVALHGSELDKLTEKLVARYESVREDADIAIPIGK